MSATLSDRYFLARSNSAFLNFLHVDLAIAVFALASMAGLVALYFASWSRQRLRNALTLAAQRGVAGGLLAQTARRGAVGDGGALAGQAHQLGAFAKERWGSTGQAVG